MRTIQNVTKISLFAALLAGGAWLWAAPGGGGSVEVEAEEGRDSVPVDERVSLIDKNQIDTLDRGDVVFRYAKNPDTSNMNSVLVWIDFFDSNRKLRSSYDVSANNPYSSEEYTPFLSDSYLNADAPILDRRRHPNFDWRNDAVQYASMTMVGGVTPCQTVVLAYYLQAIGKDKTLLGVVGTFVLLDSTGKEITRFEDLEDVFFGEGVLTCDHRYFCFRFGGPFTVNGQRMYNDHFRIYDVDTKEIIYDWELPHQCHVNMEPHQRLGEWVVFGYISMEKHDYQQRRFVYDLKRRKKYTSPLDTKLNYVSAFTEDGFIIQNPSTGVSERIQYKDWPSEEF